MLMTTTRRRLLTGLASTIALGPFIGCAGQRTLPTDPFTLGVASGDPDATSVVLWTRLAPAPLQPDGGMPPTAVPVTWEIATDETMRQVVGRGTIEARPEEGHSLHVAAGSLQPERPYWYRFSTPQFQSRIGRTRTLPAADGRPAQFRLAVAGCQRIEQGFFTGWGDIARSDIDLVFHYGDYIYEYELKEPVISARMGRSVGPDVLPPLSTLAQYRMRYALYKLDPDLAAAHAAHPFVISFDDHEVSNDWGGADSGSVPMDEATFLKLRAAAFQAFYENAPLRPAQRPRADRITAYRAVQAGSLLRLAALDTRQFRSPPACPRTQNQRCDARLDANRSMIGADQERWLTGLFGNGGTTWTVLGNQVMMMQRQMQDPALGVVDIDKWDGNPAARRRVLQAAAERKLTGLITVTGDVHRTFVGDLKADYEDPKAATVGAEFVASSISSVGDGKPEPEIASRVLAANPHMRYYDWRRGYLVCAFDDRQCEASYRAIDYVSRPGSPVSTIARFAVEARKPGLA